MGCEGEQGAVGPTGLDGLNSLVNIANEPAGNNCENGGIKVEVGIDNNSNGTLDSNEILNTSYVCNGVDGNSSLTTVTTEPSGDNCENGGVKIDSGIDENGDGTLDNTEITATAYVCNGIDGNDGLIKTTNEAVGTNCENGGIKIDSGIDTNGNGSLDVEEITATTYVCNGIDGNNSLTKMTNEAAGTNCETGGVKIDSGIDTNGDGTLDESEITATAYVCNGIDGNDSLTKITNEAAGSNCENGGLKIDTGVDTDANGILDDTEIRATAYTCNGVDGNISLVNVTDELAGENCENGGVKIESGVDDNANGTLDEEEVSIERFICNGVDGGFDLQVRLFLLSGSVARGTNGPPTLGGEFLDFDKRNYIGVDSIIFSPRLKADRANNAVTVELYDVTNDRVIDNTALSTNSTDVIRMKSPDIFDDLPEEEIDLAVQMSSENFVCDVCTTGLIQGETYLILYRSN
ncbi:DUF7151 family protein [Hyunsoonleella rubra]|uniref:DUF7151 domain-containing protein n=1 Tax=Hyunsoonleella rubra TaxID=1737062 RepID=A0ABW5TB89_9FLAO